MPKISSFNNPFENGHDLFNDEPTADEMKLLNAFRGYQPDVYMYLDEQRALFERVQDLEEAQLRLAKRGWLQLTPLQQTRGRTDRLQQACLSLDGFRKLEELQ